MSNDQALVQVNIKSGEGYDATLVNVYAKTPDELVQLLEAVKTHAPLIAEAKGAVAFAHGIEVKKGSVSTQVEAPAQAQQQGGWAQPQQQAAPSWSNPAQQGPACKHGPMVARSGNKNGKSWSGFFCPTPRGTSDQCPPQFAKG